MELMCRAGETEASYKDDLGVSLRSRVKRCPEMLLRRIIHQKQEMKKNIFIDYKNVEHVYELSELQDATHLRQRCRQVLCQV
jgi:hypothetical protein